MVISGIGVVAPGEPGTAAFWDLVTSGRSATRLMTLVDPEPFRSQVAAEVDFDPVASGLSDSVVATTDRVAQFATVAAREALIDAAGPTDSYAPDRRAVVLGSAVGSTPALERQYRAMSRSGEDWLVSESAAAPEFYGYYAPSSIPAALARAFGARGPVTTVSSGCTSGIDAVAHAVDLIAERSADIALAGAAEAPISPITIACFDAIRATTPRRDSPESASRPFDNTRDGFVLAEGAAMFVLEDADRAAARGATIYAAVGGHAERANAHHMTGLRRDGRELAGAITTALRRTRIRPDRLGYISAHGSGTQQNDRHETAAYKAALGDAAAGIPISSIKSMVGHSLGAIGAIEIAACALTLRHGVIPPTANLSVADPECDLDYVPGMARTADVQHALTVGSGFGGFQSAMVLSEAG